MPKCGSQCWLCDVPIRYDTYEGCSHGCVYCFAKKFQDISKVIKGESVSSLKSFISGKRTKETNWCDWDIPIHWGGMSDPFQPCEKIHRISYEALKVLRDSQYPFIVSTKGALVADDEYLDLLSECNAIVQISMVCSSYDKLERGCPSYEERLRILEKVSKRVKRTIVRAQPYMCEVFSEVKGNMKKIKAAGAYGVVIEGMKFEKKKKGLVKVGGDFTYPYESIRRDFLALREEAHKQGLKIYSGENRTRRLGDSLSCCGFDDLEGFRGNTFNLNHLLNGDKTEPTEKMKEVGTADVFGSLHQTALEHRRLKEVCFADAMLDEYRKSKKRIDETMGVGLG